MSSQLRQELIQEQQPAQQKQQLQIAAQLLEYRDPCSNQVSLEEGRAKEHHR
jgi:hypothetical protein